jgi:hypothetical protein
LLPRSKGVFEEALVCCVVAEVILEGFFGREELRRGDKRRERGLLAPHPAE